MNEIISNSQCSFIKGRQITDRILVANEYVDFLRKSSKGIICKIDLEKGFDRVDGDSLNDFFLKKVLVISGFSGF